MTEFQQISGSVAKSTASVVFLHGLAGDAFSTWTIGNQESHYWPRWLDLNFPSLAVYAVRYDAEFIGHSQYINERALNILASIRVRDNFQTKPFIFICHSLGGLVAKQVVLSCQSDAGINPRHQKILEMFRGIAFYATPHRGARLAALARDIFPGALVGKALSDLAAGSSSIDIIHTGYKNWAEQNSRASHLAYFETKNTAGAKIVDNVSADPGLPRTTPIALDFNHEEICKFKSCTDERYLQISQFVRDCLCVKYQDNTSLPESSPRAKNVRKNNWKNPIIYTVLSIIIIVTSYVYTFMGVDDGHNPAELNESHHPKISIGARMFIKLSSEIGMRAETSVICLEEFQGKCINLGEGVIVTKAILSDANCYNGKLNANNGIVFKKSLKKFAEINELNTDTMQEALIGHDFKQFIIKYIFGGFNKCKS